MRKIFASIMTFLMIVTVFPVSAHASGISNVGWGRSQWNTLNYRIGATIHWRSNTNTQINISSLVQTITNDSTNPAAILDAAEFNIRQLSPWREFFGWDRIGPLFPNQTRRSEYFPPNATLQKPVQVFMLAGIGNSWIAGWEVFYRTGTTNIQRFFNNGVIISSAPLDVLDEEAAGIHAFDVNFNSLDDNFEIIRDFTLSRNRDFSDIVPVLDVQFNGRDIRFQVDADIDINELYIAPPIIARPESTSVTVNLELGESVDMRNGDWLSITEVDYIEEAETASIVVNFDALDITDIFPRKAQITIGGEAIDVTLSSMVFDSDGKFINGKFVFEVPLDIYRQSEVSRTVGDMEMVITEVMHLETLYNAEITPR